jgi:predicted Zn-dependent protease
MSGVFYDGKTSKRWPVRIELENEGLALYEGETRLSHWPAAQILIVEEGETTRLAYDSEKNATQRLDITDKALAERLIFRLNLRQNTRKREKKTTKKVLLWSGVALAATVLFLTFGMPLLARYLTPLVPVRMEAALGKSIDGQLQSIFKRLGAEKKCVNPQGLAAFNKLIAQLEPKAELRVPLTVSVVDSSIPNAFATSGGYSYIFKGLIDKAESPDQLAGVMAHEFGHLYHRHVIKNIIETSGVGFFLGQVFGDFTGSAAILYISREIISSKHSREAEQQSDSYGIQLMLKAKGDPRALATMLEAIDPSKKGETGMLEWLRSHPVTQTRAADIRKESGDVSPRPPLLTGEEWLALKAICDKTIEPEKPKEQKT